MVVKFRKPLGARDFETVRCRMDDWLVDAKIETVAQLLEALDAETVYLNAGPRETMAVAAMMVARMVKNTQGPDAPLKVMTQIMAIVENLEAVRAGWPDGKPPTVSLQEAVELIASSIPTAPPHP
jgi:hypothetical protein